MRPSAPQAPPALADADLVAALRAGDEATFRALVHRHDPSLRRLARLYVDDAVVGEVVQDTWLAVITGLDRFEGHSSVRTWIHRILLNQARTRGVREARTVAAPLFEEAPAGLPRDLHHPELGPGYWPASPPTWDHDPEDRALAAEVRAAVRIAIEELPARQREVIALRDVEGWTSDEVCDALRLTAANQRVLLHRARVHVRARLEEEFGGR